MDDLVIPNKLLPIRWMSIVDKAVYGYLLGKYLASNPTKKTIKQGGVPFNDFDIYEELYLPYFPSRNTETIEPMMLSILTLSDLGLITIKVKKGCIHKFIVNELPDSLDRYRPIPFVYRTKNFKKSLEELRFKASLHYRVGIDIHLEESRDVKFAVDWFDATFPKDTEVIRPDGSKVIAPITELNDYNYCPMRLQHNDKIFREFTR